VVRASPRQKHKTAGSASTGHDSSQLAPIVPAAELMLASRSSKHVKSTASVLVKGRHDRRPIGGPDDQPRRLCAPSLLKAASCPRPPASRNHAPWSRCSRRTVLPFLRRLQVGARRLRHRRDPARRLGQDKDVIAPPTQPACDGLTGMRHFRIKNSPGGKRFVRVLIVARLQHRVALLHIAMPSRSKSCVRPSANAGASAGPGAARRL